MIDTRGAKRDFRAGLLTTQLNIRTQSLGLGGWYTSSPGIRYLFIKTSLEVHWDAIPVGGNSLAVSVPQAFEKYGENRGNEIMSIVILFRIEKP